MNTASYFILEATAPTAGTAPTAVGGLMGFGARTFGAPADAPEAKVTAHAPAVKVSAAEMSPNEAAAERKRDGVQIVARTMPITLIRPLQKPVVATAPASKVEWGIFFFTYDLQNIFHVSGQKSHVKSQNNPKIREPTHNKTNISSRQSAF